MSNINKDFSISHTLRELLKASGLGLDDDPDFEAYQSLMESAMSLYPTHLQNRMELKQKKHKSKNAFFYDLLYGNLKRNEKIIQMGRVWG